jgi:DNA topoisomerase-2
MYLNASSKAAEAAGGAAIKPSVIFETIGKRWEVAFALSDGQQQQVSFANSIATTKGGTHVDMVATQLANKLYVSTLIIRSYSSFSTALIT